tara:strand:- start:81 stop:245 length:165 start_codon:yes stop_codon:yes gene_type:complete
MSLTDSIAKKNYSNSYKSKHPPKEKIKKLHKNIKKLLPSFEDIKKNIPSNILKD